MSFTRLVIVFTTFAVVGWSDGWVGGELESNAKHSFQLLGQKNVGQQKNLGPKSWVKVRSVTAEIMLIWKIVARTYVD